MEKEILYRFFRGETGPDEERRLMEWLDANEENRRTFDRERAVFDALLLFAPVPGAAQRSPGMRLRRMAGAAARIAAVVALAVGVGWGFVAHRERGWEQLTNRVVVPAGQRINLTLQDGTSVWLNSGAEIEYPALFAGDTRQVRLKGTALFDVSHDAGHPFVVETYACRVEVLGTRFNVNADEQHGIFSTALLRGSVRVTPHDAPQRQVTLRPNEKVSLHDGRLTLGRADDPNEYLWTEGLISVSGCSFEELLHRLEHCYGVRFDVRLKEMPQFEAVGKIRISDGIEHALDILQLLLQIEGVGEREVGDHHARGAEGGELLVHDIERLAGLGIGGEIGGQVVFHLHPAAGEDGEDQPDDDDKKDKVAFIDDEAGELEHKALAALFRWLCHRRTSCIVICPAHRAPRRKNQHLLYSTDNAKMKYGKREKSVNKRESGCA